MISIENPQPATVQIRSAQPADVAALFHLIEALAAYEKLSHQVTGSPEALRSHLFGDRPFAEALVAEAQEALAPWAGDDGSRAAPLLSLATYITSRDR